ncbi:MAG: MltA domain-containing protein [Hyphomonadaceae bacterium]|nr:MltA domain-containing protein [Hyphomonadaceae bacterium]
MQFRTLLSLAFCSIVLSGCASAPPPRQPGPVVAPAPPPEMALPGTFDTYVDFPEWEQAKIGPGLRALRRSCETILSRSAGEYLSPRATWAGRVDDWLPLCGGLAQVADAATAQRLVEALTVPVEIVDPAGGARFTGYFEPMIEARTRPGGSYTAPVPGPPSDMVQTETGPMQRQTNGALRPYPPRAEIRPEPRRVLGYAHPADVFFLQIQGSGRLRFPNGHTVRAAYYAHNGQPFRSTANWLINQGKISRGEASMQGIRAWMDRVSPAEAREAMNANPRYVFFQELPEGNPALGPDGAAGIALTPLGSMAVDPDYHAYGMPFLVSTTAPGLGGSWSGLLVAQDTGGAITGPVRGDIYFGTGSDAGARAGTMNAPGRMWALVPRAVADRLTQTELAGFIGAVPVAP